MKYIELTQGYSSIVDDKTFNILSGVKWCAAKLHGNIYGYRSIYLGNKKSKTTTLHSMAYLVMTGKLVPSGMVIDHIDGNALNNQISNLRVCTRQQNNLNRAVRKSSKTGVSGVRRKGNRFIAMIGIKGKSKWLGIFDTIEEAISVREAAVKEYYGEYARKPKE